MSGQTRFWWVRHLPVAEHGSYLGRRDVDAVVQGEPPAMPQGAVWFSSPLKRALATAKWLGADMKGLVTADALMEQDFGAWEGRSYEEVWQQEQDLHDWHNPDMLKPQGGECFLEVCARVDRWIGELLTMQEGRDIVVVAHAGVIRAALCHALNISTTQALAFQLDYASVTHISLYAEGAAVHYVNRLADSGA